MTFSIATHNGTITIVNPETNGHRTFRIVTQPEDAAFAPGKRVVAMLTGPDNTWDYTAFGFVVTGELRWNSEAGRMERSAAGKVLVFRKFLGTEYESMAWILEHAGELVERKKIKVEWAATCRRCGRLLTEPVSLERGIGPECERRERKTHQESSRSHS